MARLPFDAGASAAALLAVLGAWVVVGDSRVAIVGALLLPLLLGWTGARHSGDVGGPILLLLALFYALTVPLRAFGIVTSGYRGVSLASNPVSQTLLANVVLTRALGMVCLLATARLIVARAAGLQSLLCRGDTEESSDDQLVRDALMFTCVLGAALGLGLVLAGTGGVTHARALLGSHSKQVQIFGPTRYGVALWSVFALPASWLLGAKLAVPTSRRTWLNAGCLAGLIVSMVAVFGSRLQPVLAAVGIWVAWTWYGRKVGRAWVLLGAATLIAITPWVIAARTGNSQGASQGLEQVIGYGVLDASIAVEQDPAHLRQYVTSAPRWQSLATNVLPNVLTGGANTSSQSGLDAQVADQFGDVNQRGATGYPTSYATELWLMGGVAGVAMGSVAVGVALGLLIVALSARSSGHRRRSPGTLLVVAWSAVSIFTYVKDGDVVTTLSTYIRVLSYLILLTWLVRLGTGAALVRRRRLGTP